MGKYVFFIELGKINKFMIFAKMTVGLTTDGNRFGCLFLSKKPEV